ncbi:hypothetical protein IV498_03410 [Paenarthrobacter sp. Z7-10]|uniref:hypothetical protein n=1 Tax=Paenarthrobacter sp. Z7-10 TaxID=2787635 RepID=UPI0022A93AF5|nr:hypothetical protein [Paenarthrobacter sp. Z7-10]MCZ2402252.1 hypothetical protein [Paenarthrobacter sp. Z7-10]
MEDNDVGPLTSRLPERVKPPRKLMTPGLFRFQLVLWIALAANWTFSWVRDLGESAAAEITILHGILSGAFLLVVVLLLVQWLRERPARKAAQKGLRRDNF